MKIFHEITEHVKERKSEFWFHGDRYYDGPAKSFVTVFGFLQCYVLIKHIFITKPSKYFHFTETHFCNLFTQSRKIDK